MSVIVVLDGWRLLRPGSGPGVVLAIDFTLAKVRAQANFGDLARLLPDGPAVWGTEETCWPSAGGPPELHLEQWLRRTRDVAGAQPEPGPGGAHPQRFMGGEVRGILGFCAGASLALALAASLADRNDQPDGQPDGQPGGHAPPVILLDPTAVDAQTMIEQCDASMRRMAAPAEAALPAEADPLGGDDSLGGDDLDRLATVLTERYVAVATPVCVAQRVPPPIMEQLRRRVETNLRYLALCATAGLRSAAPALVVLSRDHAVPPQLRGRTAREVRLEVSQNELLADTGAAVAVSRALATPLFMSLTGGTVTPTNSAGVPWTGAYVNANGDPTVDLRSNIAAESRAKIVYEYLKQFTDDPGIQDTLSFLMTREVAHFQQFTAALNDLPENFPPGRLPGDDRFQNLAFNMSDGQSFRGPWNEGQGPWPRGVQWRYIEQPVGEWLSSAEHTNRGDAVSGAATPAVAGSKPFVHQEHIPTT